MARRSRSNRRSVPNPNLGGLIPLPPRSPPESPPPSPPQPQSTPPPLTPSSPVSDYSMVDSHESWMDALPSPGLPAVTTRAAAATAAIISVSSSDSDSGSANSTGSSFFSSPGEKVAAAVLLGWTAANAVSKNREDDQGRVAEIVELLRKGSISRLDAFKRLEYLDKQSRQIAHLLICFQNAVRFGKPDVFLKECDKMMKLKDERTSQMCSEAVMHVAEVLESQFELVLDRLDMESPLLGLLKPGSLETAPAKATVEQIIRLKYTD